MTLMLLASLLSAIPPAASRQGSAPPAPSTPQAQLTDEQIRDRIEVLLGTIDTRMSGEDWLELGTRGAAILEQIAQDPKALATRRAKAVEGLAALGSASAPDLLLRMAGSEDEALIVRLAAVRNAHAVVPSARLVTALKPVLETSREGHVRSAAAEVLSRHGGCGLVRAQARREDEPLRMQRALDSCNQQ